MEKLQGILKKWWFPPVTPERLAILRIATGGFSLWYLLSRFGILQRMVQNTDAFEPIGILGWMQEPLDLEVFWWISLVLIGLNICYILGWKFRITGPAFAILTLLFFTYRNSWSMLYHNRNALVLHILILGFVASADAWSWDSLKNRRNSPKNPHWKYGWPIMLISSVTVGYYFLSAIAKLAGDLALEWMDGSAMRSQIAVDAIRKSILGAETSPLFNTIYEHTWLFFAMGVFALVIELGAPLALYKKSWGKVWALLTLAMHWGVFVIMGIRFRYQMTGLVFLSFFEPEKCFSNAKAITPKKNRDKLEEGTNDHPIILFDGICNICNSWVQFVIKNERRPIYRFASLQSGLALSKLKEFNVKDVMGSIVLIEGDRLYQKSEAVLRILGKLKLPWPLLQIFLIVPRVIRDAVYDVVAKNRYKWFGKKEHCTIMAPEERLRFLK